MLGRREPTPIPPRSLAGDADRERLLGLLREHYARGGLTSMSSAAGRDWCWPLSTPTRPRRRWPICHRSTWPHPAVRRAARRVAGVGTPRRQNLAPAGCRHRSGSAIRPAGRSPESGSTRLTRAAITSPSPTPDLRGGWPLRVADYSRLVTRCRRLTAGCLRVLVLASPRFGLRRAVEGDQRMDRHAAFLAGGRIPEFTDQLLYPVVKLGGPGFRHVDLRHAQHRLAVGRPGRRIGAGALVLQVRGEEAVTVGVE